MKNRCTLSLLSIALLFFLVWSNKAQAFRCESVFAHTLESPRSFEKFSEFEQLIGRLKYFDDFKALYSQFNEASKKITIEEHTRDVFKQYLLESRNSNLHEDFLRIMPVVIALHDIGKPLAIAVGKRDDQHLYTVPLMKRFLKENQWQALDIERAVALVTYSGMGDLVKGRKAAFHVAQEISLLAERIGVSPMDFYLAKKAFYLSDAGAYQQLRGRVFVESPVGTLVPRGLQFEELEYWLFRDAKGSFGFLNNLNSIPCHS